MTVFFYFLWEDRITLISENVENVIRTRRANKRNTNKLVAQTEKMVTASLIIDTFKSNMVAAATIMDDIIVTTRSHYQPECPVFGIDTMERYWSII